MLSIDLIVAGRMRKGPLYELVQDYKGRIRWPLAVHEIESKYTDPANQQADEERKISALLRPDSFVIVLDERGSGLRSLDFAKTIENLRNSGEEHLQFVIGGAEGLTDTVRSRANLLLSFGQQTWPHMMARVMLMEQIYRAQQILAGHPYHRE